VRKFEPNPRHPTAVLDYTRYGISVENPSLVKAYMKFRYRGRKHHHIFVLIDKAKTGDSVTEYYCESDAQTVGCCNHIMTIVRFLGYGQYHGINISNPDICNVSITIKKEQKQKKNIRKLNISIYFHCGLIYKTKFDNITNRNRDRQRQTQRDANSDRNNQRQTETNTDRDRQIQK